MYLDNLLDDFSAWIAPGGNLPSWTPDDCYLLEFFHRDLGRSDDHYFDRFEVSELN